MVRMASSSSRYASCDRFTDRLASLSLGAAHPSVPMNSMVSTCNRSMVTAGTCSGHRRRSDGQLKLSGRPRGLGVRRLHLPRGAFRAVLIVPLEKSAAICPNAVSHAEAWRKEMYVCVVRQTMYEMYVRWRGVCL
jgi:hypothetical protein